MPSTPSGIPSANSGGLSPDEQLDGPVLALLTTAQQQQASGDLNGASSVSSAPSVSRRVSRKCFIVWLRCAWLKAMRHKPSSLLVVA